MFDIFIAFFVLTALTAGCTYYLIDVCICDVPSFHND